MVLLFPILHPFPNSNGKGEKETVQLGDFPPPCEHKVTQDELSIVSFTQHYLLIITYKQDPMLETREHAISQLNILTSKSM